MALVTVDDNGVMVCLPYGKKIDYHNRTSLIVKTNDGKAVEGVSVNAVSYTHLLRLIKWLKRLSLLQLSTRTLL